MKDKESILDIKDEKLGVQGMCISSSFHLAHFKYHNLRSQNCVYGDN